MVKSNYVEIVQSALYEAIGHEIMPVFYTEDELENLKPSKNKETNEAEQFKEYTPGVDEAVIGGEQFNTHNTFETFVDLATGFLMQQVLLLLNTRTSI